MQVTSFVCLFQIVTESMCQSSEFGSMLGVLSGNGGRLTLQAQVGQAFAVRVGLGGVLGVVEDIDLRAHSLCRYQEIVEGAVPRTVHLALMVDLLNDLHANHIYFDFATTSFTSL